MIINYLGGGSFKLQSGSVSMLLNPDNNRFKADVTLRTLAAVDFSPGETSTADVEIFFPGEYDVKNIEITGIAVPEESTDKFLKTIYLVAWEDMKIVFLGHISKHPPADILEKIEEPDVLILPVGGGHFLSPEDAAKLAKKIEPSFIVPCFYKTPSDFLKAMGQKGEQEEKLVFKKKDLEGAKNKVVVLKS